MDNVVYVVTFGALQEEDGRFYDEVAYVDIGQANGSALACMAEHPAETFREVHSKEPHIVRAWDGQRTTVWLEQLRVGAAPEGK
ncbi:hypothetical protein LCGC14_1617980 [marine sediment metagenome]|uniref:Uncharacterized protein n=1 Tax=marine sediment metagenome TaxID=412755 RepID=A0A0F9I6M6_9ZZZZ